MRINKTLCLLLLLIPASAICQIRDGEYQAFKIEKDNTVELISINVVPLGNGILHFHHGDPRNPLTGHYRILSNRREYHTGHFKKGILDGQWETIYDDQPLEIVLYKNGHPDGKFTRYSRNNGEIEYVYTYASGLKQHYISYHPDGSVKDERFYDDKGYPHGEMFAYDPDGNITHERRYNHGQLEGLQISTEQDGRRTMQEYANDKRRGKFVRLYPNGNKCEEGNYDDNAAKTGKWTTWTEDGSLESETDFLNNQPHGEKRIYYPGENLKISEEYIAGKLHGKKTEYDESPHRISRELVYSEDKLHGEFKIFHNGVLWREGKYQNGKLVYEKEFAEGKLQIVKLLDETGSLVNVEKYDKTGKRTYKNTDYRKHASVNLKESASGVIDIEIE